MVQYFFVSFYIIYIALDPMQVYFVQPSKSNTCTIGDNYTQLPRVVIGKR